MNDEQLVEYLKNRPPELKTVKIQSSQPKEKLVSFFKNAFFLESKILIKEHMFPKL